MCKKAFLLILFFLGISIDAQSEFNSRINKDSLFESILRSYPHDLQIKNMRKAYSTANTEGKEYLLTVLYDSNYTKENLIENFEKNKVEILELSSAYSQLVPKGLIVETSIVTNNLYLPKKSISIKIYKIKNGYLEDNRTDNTSNLQLVSTYTHLNYGTKEMEEVLKTLNWTENTLRLLEKKFNLINCFSIQNGEPSFIKYKKTGLAFLSYKLFPKNLTKQQIIENNDGCNHIFYKDNVVLVSDNGQDGARGALCFP